MTTSIALAHEPAREHVAVHLVVFDQRSSPSLHHPADVRRTSTACCLPARSAAGRRTASRIASAQLAGWRSPPWQDLAPWPLRARASPRRSDPSPSRRRPGSRAELLGRSCMRLAGIRSRPSPASSGRAGSASGGGWPSSHASASRPFAASATRPALLLQRARAASRGSSGRPRPPAPDRPSCRTVPAGASAARPLAVDRLGQVVGGAEREAHAAVVDDRHHDDRDVAQLRVGLQRCQHRPAVHLRHHHVEGDRVGRSSRASASPSSPLVGMDRRDSPRVRGSRRSRSRTAGSSSMTSTVARRSGAACERALSRRACARPRRPRRRQRDGEGRALARARSRPSTSPPIIWQNCRVIARPSPVPPYLRVVEASAWVKAWNSLPSCSCGHADAGVARPRNRPVASVGVGSRRRRASSCRSR